MFNKIISVIIPVYNLEKYISRCLDSILSQTYTNLEIITVDDGSTDNSPKILDEYAARDRRIKVIHKSNGGVALARNTGLDSATGELIGFIDGDDYIQIDMYERLAENLEKNNADISHCGMRIVGIKGEVKEFYGSGRIVEQDHDKGLYDVIDGSYIEPTCCNKLYRRELFEGIRFEPEIKFNEDNLINAKLFSRANKSIYEDFCPYSYVRRDGSACHEKIGDKHVFHPLMVREKIIDICRGESDLIQKRAMEAYIHANISAYSLITTGGDSTYKKAKRYFRKNLCENRKSVSLLPRNGRMHAYLIIYLPLICTPILKAYYRFFAKNDYS